MNREQHEEYFAQRAREAEQQHRRFLMAIVLTLAVIAAAALLGFWVSVFPGIER